MVDFSEWNQAKQLHDTQHFDEALKELQTHPQDNASYYYNVGTLFLQLKKPSKAIAYLEKAYRLQPHDPEIQANLALAKEEVGFILGSDQLDPASSWIEKMGDHIPAAEAQGAVALLSLVFIGVWIRTYLKIRNLKRFISQPATLICLIGLLITSTVFGLQKWAEARPIAVSIDLMIIRSGPGEHYVQLGQIQPGTKIRLLSSAEDSWIQVRYSSDEIGWVKMSGLLTL